MNEYVGKICPYCKTEIKEEDNVKVCLKCGIPHHAACWEENKGCTTLGCKKQDTNPTDVYANCGEALEGEQVFCPKCVLPENTPEKNVCSKCGAELQDGQGFCPKCGQKVGLAVDADVSSAINQFDSGDQKTNTKKKKTPLIIAVTAVAVIIAIVIAVSGGGGKKDFNKLYSDIAGESWCTIASDGTWMKIDTNPNDIDDYISTTAYYKLKSINSDLGFSSVVIEEMNETRSIDGRQSASSDKYEVSWSYHPDQGLEVMYKVK